MRSEPELKKLDADGVEIAVWHWRGDGGNHPLLFIHASGFHGRCWDQIIRQFPKYECYAIDLRGHGRSAAMPPPASWIQMARDVGHVIHGLKLSDCVGIGHSLGGHVLCSAASADLSSFRQLILLDPVLFEPKHYLKPGEAIAKYENFDVARRRNKWQSSADLFERYRARPPFKRWNALVLKDYCDHALKETGDQMELACSPLFEASIYAMGVANESNIYGSLAKIQVPTEILRFGPLLETLGDFDSSPTNPDAVDYFPNGRDFHLPDADHFFPMARLEDACLRIDQALNDSGR